MNYQPYGYQGAYGGDADPAEEYEDEEEYETKKQGQLSCWGNQQSMNLNPLVLTNITGSPYFKVQLFNLKTYHEVIDEIYYKVDHLEPWERGSRKTAGQTGMCGGVRGVGAGGIVSSAYCLLYKLYTLKLTKKQVNGLLVHCDSPFIRGLGFMYIRYTQQPHDLWGWFEEYLNDEEEIDPKAGGGKPMTIGEMVKSMLTKLEWFDTRFPRIPVNVQKQINDALDQRGGNNRGGGESSKRSSPVTVTGRGRSPTNPLSRNSSDHGRSSETEKKRKRSRSWDRSRRSKSTDRGSRSRSKDRRHRDRSRDKGRRDRDKDNKHSHRRSRSRSRERHRHDRKEEMPRSDYADELKKYSEHKKSEHKKSSHKKHRTRSRSRDRR